MKSYHELLSPKEINIDGIVFYISKFDCIEGREIIFNYTSSNIPKIGNYRLSEEMMLKLMTFVAVSDDSGNKTILLSKKILGAHLNNSEFPWQTLCKLEAAMMEYNVSFFQNGGASTFFGDFAQKVPAWISSTLTDSLGQLLQTEQPPSKN